VISKSDSGYCEDRCMGMRCLVFRQTGTVRRFVFDRWKS